MVQPISNLAVGAKVKSLNTKYNGVPIVWQVGHKADGRVKLISEKIITLKCFDAKEASNPDSDRKNNGNNRYSQSNIDQWLNSAAGAGSWYSARHSYDAPPNNANVHLNQNEYDAQPGFLSFFEESFRNAILDTTIRIAKNTVTDGGGYEDITRKVYLLSNTEVGLPNENGVAEGSKWNLFSNDNSRKANPTAEAVSASEYTNSSLNASSPWYWWLRTPNAGTSHYARNASTDGALNDNRADRGNRGVRPALEVGSGILVSDSVDTDGAYIINWTERHEGGSTATVTIAAQAAGGRVVSGGSEASLTVSAQGTGTKTTQGGSYATVTIQPQGNGTKTTQGGSTSNITIAAQAAGAKVAQGGSETTGVVVSAEGAGVRFFGHTWRPGQTVLINLPDRGVTGEFLIQRVTIRPCELFDKWTFNIEYGGRLSGIADFLQAMVAAQQKKNLTDVKYLSKYIPGDETIGILDEVTITPRTTPWICGDADAICGEIVCLASEG